MAMIFLLSSAAAIQRAGHQVSKLSAEDGTSRVGLNPKPLKLNGSFHVTHMTLNACQALDWLSLRKNVGDLVERRMST